MTLEASHAEAARSSAVLGFLRGHGLDMAIVGTVGDTCVVLFRGTLAVASGEGDDAYAAFTKAAADFHYADA